MLALLLISLLEASEVKTVYQGVATRDDKVIYLEKHEVTFLDNEVKTAKTTYSRPDGEIIATLSNNFSQSVTLPDHEYIDLRDGRRYGVRRENGNVVMWDHKPKGKEISKSIDMKSLGDKLVIAGQGLHYYMRTHLKQLMEKELSIAILIPGKLDWYSFVVNYVGEDNQYKKFVIKTQSALLRIFAPKLEVWYREDGTLMRYRGLSNLPDDSGSNQQVEINYSY